MDEDTVRAFFRILVSMAVIGLSIGLASFLAFEWVVATDALGDNESLVLPLIPLIMLLIVAATAPLVAGILGVFEGLRGATVRRAAVAGGTCLVGGVVFVVLAALFVGQMDTGDGGGGVTLAGVVALAGFSGVASALAGASTTLANGG